MKTIATIDCGTTNSRFSLVNEKGEVLYRAAKKVGVKDTAIRRSNEFLKEGLRELFDETLAGAGIAKSSVDLMISSGMIDRKSVV